MKQLFTLLRLGLGTSTIDNESLSDFNMLTPEQWRILGDLSRRQGVLGIMLDGVDQLGSMHQGLTNNLEKKLKLGWIGEVLKVEQRNSRQKEVMNEVASKWNQEGCQVMVMKGQVNGLLYPKPLHRSPGDIDCYLFDDYSFGNELARMWGAEVNESWYKHSVIHFKGETIENHLFFVHTREGRRSKQLQSELKNALNVKEWETFPESIICLPPVQWNAMFLTYHACCHFIKEGLRLKQLLDWAMFLQKEQTRVDWSKYYSFCDRYHLRVFADATNAICVKYLGVIISNPAITIKSEFADKILQSILYDDDYIYGAGEGKWKSRFHLVRSLVIHRWKYKEIYQQSIWKQFWWYLTGFLFHTEKA